MGDDAYNAGVSFATKQVLDNDDLLLSAEAVEASEKYSRQETSDPNAQRRLEKDFMLGYNLRIADRRLFDR